MKYFIDTEFIENGITIELISIGIVCEDGRELYLINSDCDLSKANDWVKENVLVQLPLHPNSKYLVGSPSSFWATKRQIRRDVAEFMGAILPDSDPMFRYFLPVTKPKPELWGYYSAYDHVVLSQLFGTMMDLPKGFPMYTMCLKQWCKQLGDPELPAQGKGEHLAILDARWNRDVWHFLDEYSRAK